ncbi:MAG: hypothetical protein ACXVPU_02590 [Bacteroidia bacterium]
MKTKVISLIVLALMVIFPFRHAYLTSEISNSLSVLCMLAVVFGTLIIMIVNFSDGESHENNNKVKK